MIRKAVIICIALLAGAVHGVTITGKVIDSATADPLSGVSVLFRLGSSPDNFPRTMTDTAGRFSIALTVEQGFPLQIILERSDYLRKSMTVTIAGDTVSLPTVRLVKPAEFTAWFCGMVLDSVTRDALAGMRVVLKRKWNDTAPFLECTTDTKGQFGISVPVSGDMNGRALWYIDEPGYYSTSGDVTASMDSVAQIILLRAEGSIRVQVQGRVIDAQTRAPLTASRVILFTNFLDAIPDTFETGADGMFDRSVRAGLVSAAVPSVGYSICAPGYEEKIGGVTLGMASEVDLGDIALYAPEPVAIIRTIVPASRQDVRVARSFMLNGRTVHVQIGTRNGIRRALQVIVR